MANSGSTIAMVLGSTSGLRYRLSSRLMHGSDDRNRVAGCPCALGTLLARRPKALDPRPYQKTLKKGRARSHGNNRHTN